MGDVLLVTRVDRLARSIGDLQDIVRTLKAKGASLRATEQPIDTSTAAGKGFLPTWGSASSPSLRSTCGASGSSEEIAKAKAAGVYKGRKPSIDMDEVARLRKEGLGATEIAKRLKIGRASVYRVMAANPTNTRAQSRLEKTARENEKLSPNYEVQAKLLVRRPHG
jgi:DNA invertase Pin-like site-specific DNA recombinase